jgi:lipopolysaccharide export system protein LptA
LLLAIALIVAALWGSYYRQTRSLARHAPPPPKSLPLNTDATATDWVWNKDEGNDRVVQVRAKGFKQFNDPSRLDLDGVEMRLYKDDGKSFDQIRSAKAQFDQARQTLYSDGAVEIKLDVPVEGQPHGRLMTIQTSGVTFESKTGKAWTERAAACSFDQGDGNTIGAAYDPNTSELLMKSQVVLHWRGRNDQSNPLTIEAGQLLYQQKQSRVLLNQWARLTREGGTLEGGDTLVLLQDGAIQRVETIAAHGTDTQPNRKLDYSAEELAMDFAPNGEIERIAAKRNARLSSVSDSGHIAILGDRLDLVFDTAKGASALQTALATGNALVESDPVERPGVQTPEKRRLRSEAVLITMRDGGKELDKFETHAPGRLEFIPTRAGQRHRTVDATLMTMVYGALNQPQTFHAANAVTNTDPDPKAGADAAPSRTSSTDLIADFDPKTGQMSRMRQTGDFRYEDGAQRARAYSGALDQATNMISLDGDARIWDPNGMASADRILLDQKKSEMTAEGHVTSFRAPEPNGKSSAMLANDKPLEATADRMQTADHNDRIHYDGHAIAWQGANRIWADNLDIDRSQRRLAAKGHVRTQFLEQQKQDAKATAPSKTAPGFIVIDAAALLYTEADRLAHYSGGTHLVRPGMDVKAAEIRAFLNDANADSSLDRAFADGGAHIFRREPGRTLDGTGEHAEYYTADQRIVLKGGEPTLIDSVRGYTKGRELTYYPDDDKLLVNGVEKQPVKSLLHHRER